MLNLGEKSEVYHLGLHIGYFKLFNIIDWADKTILELDISTIPDEIYEISLMKTKKAEDVVSLLRKITKEAHIEKATRVLLGLFSIDLKNSQKEIRQVVTFVYRLAWKRDIDDDLFLELNGLESNYETAIDGYGDLQRASKDIEDFLDNYQRHGELF